MSTSVPPTPPTDATDHSLTPTRRAVPSWIPRTVALLAAAMWMVLLLPRMPRPTQALADEDVPAGSTESDEALREVLAAMVLHARSPRATHPPAPRSEAISRSLDAEFAARLDALDLPRGILRILRAGAWQLTLADAVGQRLPPSPPDRVGDAWDAWPARPSGGTVTYGRIAHALQEAYARADLAVPKDPGHFQALAAEAVGCAWLTACATGPLQQRAEAEDLLREGEGTEDVSGPAIDLAGELRRQADEAGHWCHAFFVARFTRLHGMPPLVANHLVAALGAMP